MSGRRSTVNARHVRPVRLIDALMLQAMCALRQGMIQNGEKENGRGNAEKQAETNLDLLLWSTPPGTRTPDPLIKSQLL